MIRGGLSEKAGEVPNRSSVLTFALNRKTQLPRRVESGFVPAKPPLPIHGADTKAGFRSYQRFCGGCYEDPPHSGGVLPDLRWSGAIADARPFYTIVGDGVRQSGGMVGFAANLNRQEIEAIRAYLIARANQDYIDSATIEGSRR
jgi:alcohol dehydrogenase (quinone), dehydrogenase subunit